MSYRSVYRFDDRTDLMLSAIARVMGELWPIFDVEKLGEGTLDTRIERLISLRSTRCSGSRRSTTWRGTPK